MALPSANPTLTPHHSSKAGSNLSEKQAEAVVNSYQSRLDGAHAIGNLLNDSAEETLEATDFSGTTFISQDGAESDEAYARLFGVDPAPSVVAPADRRVPTTASGAGPGGGTETGPVGVDARQGAAAGVVPSSAALGLPAVPSAVPGGHRRTPSASGDSAINWMLTGDGTDAIN